MQIDWWTLGLQTINFLIVVWLLSRFLYRPIRKIIEEREAADRKAGEDAAKKVEEAEKARAAYEQKRADLVEEHRQREAEWHEKLEQERAETLDAARKEAADMVETARQRVEDRVAALASDLARTALRGTSNGIADVTAQLAALPDEDADELRRDLADETASVAVVTVRKIPASDQAEWHKALSDWLGREAPVVFQSGPDILGGVELHFPHAALRFSAAAGLERAAETLKE
jgi:F-type H+-transporting ATPase subunit b